MLISTTLKAQVFVHSNGKNTKMAYFNRAIALLCTLNASLIFTPKSRILVVLWNQRTKTLKAFSDKNAILENAFLDLYVSY